MSTFTLIEQLIKNALEDKLIEPRDQVYTRNQLLSLLGLDGFEASQGSAEILDTPTILEALVKDAIQRGYIEDAQDKSDQLMAHMMNCFLDKPSHIQKAFEADYAASPAKATKNFYALSKASNYIQTKQIAKNINFKTDSAYGQLDITINLSKPEKDPKQIEREKAQPKPDHIYPQCFLCLENEGYGGRINHPARANHRIIELELNQKTWYLQYSPYLYYPEHSIVFSAQHEDMIINQNTFENLLSFVDKFPHYFIGSNADLPVVGGSILTHDHYQAGQYKFAMDDAPSIFDFKIKGFDQVSAQMLKWPLSVIRLQSADKDALVKLSQHILNEWIDYSDSTVDIQAYTEGTRHNTVTPIARKKGDLFEIDLVLRNNRKNDEHPEGIFHPHADVHHIKKENIGLIEVMGLAVLPGRLKAELAVVKSFIEGESAIEEVNQIHHIWAEILKDKWHQVEDNHNLDEFLNTELGYKFSKALEDAGVFKQDDLGITAFKRFIESL